MNTELLPFEVIRDILGMGLVAFYFLIPTFIVIIFVALIRQYRINKKLIGSRGNRKAKKGEKSKEMDNCVEVEMGNLRLNFDEQGRIKEAEKKTDT